MRYASVIPAVFLERPNRFTAVAETASGPETVHVKNTGRCRELLLPGTAVWLSGPAPARTKRKTAYDLIAAEKILPDGSRTLVNLDSQIVNDAAEEWLLEGNLFGTDAVIRREVTWGSSRFDFRAETAAGRVCFLEVKGCTLEKNGIALFPDAPTERGVKHVRELAACARAGYGAYLLFVLAMRGCRCLCPNEKTHPAFGAALRDAEREGVHLLAVDCTVTPDSVSVHAPVPVRTDEAFCAVVSGLSCGMPE